MPKATELRQERAKVIADMRSVIDQAEKENRTLTADERVKIDAIEKKESELRERIERLEKQDSLDKELGQTRGAFKPEPDSGGETRGRRGSSDEYRAAFEKQLRHTKQALDTNEFRSLSEGTDSEGGFLVPTTMEQKIIEKLTAANVMRQIATVITTGNDKQIPIADSEGDAAWTGEGAAFNESDDVFSQITLSAYKATRIIKISEELLNDSEFDVMNHIVNSFSRKIARLEEAAFVNGNGSAKPTGVIGSGTVGVTTASASAITADELIDLFYALTEPYRVNATWLMKDGTAKVLRKLKNGTTGDYMWQPGLRSGEPDSLLGRPVKISEHTPAIAASAKTIAFGDMSYYWIAQRGRINMQRLNELYAATGQIGFRGYERVDGKLSLAESVAIMQMHA